MKYSIKTINHKGLNILVYWVDSKGMVGKRDINKYNNRSDWFVTSAMSEQDAIELIQSLTK